MEEFRSMVRMDTRQNGTVIGGRPAGASMPEMAPWASAVKIAAMNVRAATGRLGTKNIPPVTIAVSRGLYPHKPANNVARGTPKYMPVKRPTAASGQESDKTQT